jgi:DNA-binding MarR family transcriptional regulator
VSSPAGLPVASPACNDRLVPRALTDEDYERLLQFRTSLRRFLRWSEEEAAAAGLTATQHQLLLAVRGARDPAGPTIGDVADALLLRHHSVVGLVDRAAAAGLVRRRVDASDHRLVRLELTAAGKRRLEQLTSAHLAELSQLASQLRPLLDGLSNLGDASGP